LKICHPDSKLHIYDRNKGKNHYFICFSSTCGTVDYNFSIRGILSPLSQSSNIIILLINISFSLFLFSFTPSSGAAMAFDFASHRRVPSSLHWDEQDDRLLSCEAVRARQNTTGSAGSPAARLVI